MIAKPKTPSHTVISAVNAYLMARAYAETMKEAVDAVYLEVLTDLPLYTDKAPGRRGGTARQILTQGDMYLSSNEAGIEQTYSEVNHILRERGIKPDDMPDGHCPYLTADHLQTQAEWLVIDCGAEWLEIENHKDFRHKLLCNGLDKYHQFTDLIVKMVVSQPGYKNPLTGKAVA